MDIIDPIFNMHKIKFDILDKWNLIDKSVNRVNVYINLDNVFKLILNPRVNNYIQASSSVSNGDFKNKVSRCLVSNIINLGQHYRLWLAKKSIDSRIILFWNYPLPEKFKNAKYLSFYKSDYIEKHTEGMEVSNILPILKDAEKFCKECIKYINEVYLINPGGIEASLVPYILNEEVYKKDSIPTKNILISNSLYDYSYVNYGFDILSPSIKKKKPYMVTRQNAIEVIKDRSRVSSILTVNPNFLEFITSILGNKDRNIPSITGVGIVTIMKLILTSIEDGLITNDTKDVDMLSNILREEYMEIFERNYRCINLEYQMNDVEPLDIHKITSQLVDNYDEATLNDMNEKYFKLSPIEIIRPKSEQVLYDYNPYGDSIFSKKS